MKISQKAILFISLLTLVPIIIIVTSHIWSDLKTGKEAIEHENSKLAGIAANYINNQLDKTEVLLTALETFPVVKEQNAEVTDKILKDMFPKYPFIRAIYAANIKGEVFAYSSKTTNNFMNVNDHPFFQQSLKKNSIYISERVFSIIDGQPIIRVNYPIKDNNGITVGLLTAIIPLESMQNLINIIDTGNYTSIFLVDSQGAVLAATKDLLKKFPNLKSLKAFKNLKLSQQGTLEDFNPYTKQRELFSYLPLKKTGWGIIVTQPTDEIRVNLKDNLIHEAFLFLLVIMPFGVYIFMTNLMLYKQRKELRIYNKHLEHLSYTDNLTNLYNNRYFYQQIEIELERCKRYQKSMALIILDIDDFKHYNDTNGHLKGDKVLIEFGLILKNSVRSIDTVARYGGEEFVILLPETTLESALVVAKRIKQSIYDHLFEGRENQPRGILTASIGIAIFPDHALDTTTLIDLADRALYQAKQNKNTISVTNQSMEQLKLNIEG